MIANSITLSPFDLMLLLSSEKHLKYRVANLIAEPFMASLYEPDVSKWEFCGHEKTPGVDAKLGEQNFEFKTDSGIARDGSASSNLFIETHKISESPHRLSDGPLVWTTTGKGVVSEVDSGILAARKAKSIYGMWHGQLNHAFFFDSEKLCRYIAAEYKRDRIVSSSAGTQGIILPVFGEDGNVLPVIFDLCVKIIGIDPATAEVRLLEKPAKKTIRNPRPSFVDEMTPDIAFDKATFEEALATGSDLEMEFPRLRRTVVFKNASLRRFLPRYINSVVLIPAAIFKD